MASNSDKKVHLWLRSEVKPQEGRTPLIPSQVKELLASGNFEITVEKSTDRCFSDSEYEKAGAKIVESRLWEQEGKAPSDAIIFGLKELPESIKTLSHSHIFFAHCFKEQDGWKELLEKFRVGGGKIYDLEFLKNDSGRRVAAFGRPAGLVGCALGILLWAKQQLNLENKDPLGTSGVKPWKSEDDLFTQVREALKKIGRVIRILVIGALGRCGGGAVYTIDKINEGEDKALIEVSKWDLAETKNGGPFDKAITDHEILVNCVYLTSKIPPFVDNATIEKHAANRKLSVVVDVSCDYTSANNPLPIYNQGTTVFEPSVRVIQSTNSLQPLDVISIDHLPSLLPRESSENYSEQLFPYVKELAQSELTKTWKNAENLFFEKLEQAKK